jgi:hypothetical protein
MSNKAREDALGLPMSPWFVALMASSAAGCVLLCSWLLASAVVGSNARALDVLTGFGSALLSASGWVLPALLGVIIALYAGIWIQTRLDDDVKEVQRQRLELGAASLVVAAVALAWTGFCAISTFSSGDGVGEFSGSAVLASFTLLLASRIGRFATGTLGFQEKVARREWKQARAARRRFRGVYRRPMWASTVVIVATVALPPIAVTWTAFGWLPEYPSSGRLFIALGLTLLVFACATVFASGILRGDGTPRLVRLLLWLMLVLPLIAVAHLSVSFLGAVEGIALTIGVILACWPLWLFASSLPRISRRYPLLSSFTIDGALDQFALRAAERAVRRARSRLRRLESRRIGSGHARAVPS